VPRESYAFYINFVLSSVESPIVGTGPTPAGHGVHRSLLAPATRNPGIVPRRADNRGSAAAAAPRESPLAIPVFRWTWGPSLIFETWRKIQRLALPGLGGIAGGLPVRRGSA
jgi:hypothetical protein